MIWVPPPPPPPPRLQYDLPEGINIRQRNGDPSCWMNIPFEPLVLSLRFEGDKVVVDGGGYIQGRHARLQQVLPFTCRRYRTTLE